MSAAIETVGTNGYGDCKELKVNGHVGFDSLPEQFVSKSVSSGFSFNILCVGDTGLGKSCLMETLFNQRFDFVPSTHDLSEVKLKVYSQELKEKNVRLRLTIVETAGFADQLNKENCYKPIMDFLDARFEAYLQEEMKSKRNLLEYKDTRIHACLYFLAPTGHTLRAIDLLTMQKLQEKVNIIPIIAKADTVTASEMVDFKARIMKELTGQVKFYKFPVDDDTLREQNTAMNALMPFAIVASTEDIKLPNGKTCRGRQYPWGAVQVDNHMHCDFVKLRDMLLRVNLEDLRESTHMRHYEKYRQTRLEQMGFRDDEISLQEIYENRREAQKLQQQRQEEEMRQMFVAKVKVKEEELKEAERKTNAQFEAIKRQHAEDRKHLEEKRRRFEEELNAFEKRRSSYEHSKAAALTATLKKKK